MSWSNQPFEPRIRASYGSQATNFAEKRLSDQETKAVQDLFGPVKTPFQIDSNFYNNIEFQNLLQLYSSSELLYPTQKAYGLYIKEILRNVLSVAVPPRFTNERNFHDIQYEMSHHAYEKLPVSGVVRTVTESAREYFESMRTYGLGYRVDLEILLHPKGQEIIDRGVATLVSSGELHMYIKTLQYLIDHAFDRVTKFGDEKDNYKAYISFHDLLAEERNTTFIGPKSRNGLYAHLADKQSSMPGANMFIVPSGTKRYFNNVSLDVASKLLAWFEIQDDSTKKWNRINVDGPNMLRLSDGTIICEIPDYKPSPSAESWNPLFSYNCRAEFYTSDRSPALKDIVKFKKGVELYDMDLDDWRWIGLDEMIHYSGTFDDKTGEYTKEAVRHIVELNAHIRENNNNIPSDQDPTYVAGIRKDGMRNVKIERPKEMYNTPGAFDTPMWAQYNAGTRTLTPASVIGNMSWSNLTTARVHMSAMEAIDQAQKHITSFNIKEAILDTVQLVSEIEDEPLTMNYINSLRVTVNGLAVRPTPSEITEKHGSTIRNDVEPNSYGSIPLPAMDNQATYLYPVGYGNGRGLETIAAEANKATSRYHALALRAREIVRKLKVVASKIRELFPGSLLLSDANQPDWVHVPNELDNLIGAFLPERVPVEVRKDVSDLITNPPKDYAKLVDQRITNANVVDEELIREVMANQEGDFDKLDEDVQYLIQMISDEKPKSLSDILMSLHARGLNVNINTLVNLRDQLRRKIKDALTKDKAKSEITAKDIEEVKNSFEYKDFKAAQLSKVVHIHSTSNNLGWVRLPLGFSAKQVNQMLNDRNIGDLIRPMNPYRDYVEPMLGLRGATTDVTQGAYPFQEISDVYSAKTSSTAYGSSKVHGMVQNTRGRKALYPDIIFARLLQPIFGNKHFLDRCEDCDSISQDPTERLFMFAYLTMPLNSRYLGIMTKNNVSPPFTGVAWRLSIRVKTANGILMIPGAANLMLAPPRMYLSQNMTQRQALITSIIEGTPKLIQRDGITLLRHLYPCGYEGGQNTRIMKNQSDWINHGRERDAVICTLIPSTIDMRQMARFDHTSMPFGEKMLDVLDSSDMRLGWPGSDYYKVLWGKIIAKGLSEEYGVLRNSYHKPDVCLTAFRGPCRYEQLDGKKIFVKGTGTAGGLETVTDGSKAVWEGKSTCFPEVNSYHQAEHKV